MNIPLSKKTRTPGMALKFAHIFRSTISNYILNLNARINAKPMPRHHRMGSWQHKVRECTKQINLGEKNQGTDRQRTEK
jgi:hypothetical protein